MSWYTLDESGEAFGPAAHLAPTLEPKLPELCDTLCQDCEGTGYQATADLEDAWRCKTCDGYGVLIVCSVCGQVPAADTDACGCGVGVMA